MVVSFSASIWVPIFTATVSVIISIFGAYGLDRLRANKQVNEKRINIYRRIFEEFVRDGEKTYKDSQSFRDFLSSNRHFLEKEFKKIVPVSFEPLTILNGYNASSFYELKPEDIMFIDINGDILYSVENGNFKYSGRYYWFIDPDDVKRWTEVALKALESYNDLSSDYITPPNAWYVRSVKDPL